VLVAHAASPAARGAPPLSSRCASASCPAVNSRQSSVGAKVSTSSAAWITAVPASSRSPRVASWILIRFSPRRWRPPVKQQRAAPARRTRALLRSSREPASDWHDRRCPGGHHFLVIVILQLT